MIALKASFEREVGRVREAVDTVRATGWAGDRELVVFEGPDEYLFGEETVLLEVLDGRGALPTRRPALSVRRRRDRR